MTTLAAWAPSSGIFAPTTGYDITLFDRRHQLRPGVRRDIMERLDTALRVDGGLTGSEWQDELRVYIAGGSASEWAGGRPNDVAQDLDVLIGVDYSRFRGNQARGNPEAITTNEQINGALNAALRNWFNADRVWMLVKSDSCQTPSQPTSPSESSSATARASATSRSQRKSASTPRPSAAMSPWPGSPGQDLITEFSRRRTPSSPSANMSLAQPQMTSANDSGSVPRPSSNAFGLRESRYVPEDGSGSTTSRWKGSGTTPTSNTPAGTTSWPTTTSPGRSTSGSSPSREDAAPSVSSHHLTGTSSKPITTTSAVQANGPAGSASEGFSAGAAIEPSGSSGRATSQLLWTTSPEQHPAPEGWCWAGPWNLTGFVNENAWDIRKIKPYAAWDVSRDRWAVHPPHLPGHALCDFDPALIAEARAVATWARSILRLPEPARTREARGLWEHIHRDRSRAFSDEGEGWQDPGNLIEKWLAYAPHGLLGKIRELVYGDHAALPTTKQGVSLELGAEGATNVGPRQAVSGYDGLDDRSAMICLEIPEGLVNHLAHGVHDSHITVVYLGKLSEEAFQKACLRAQVAANDSQPMEGVMHGIGTFLPSESSDWKTPAYVPAYVSGIGHVRRQLEDLNASKHTDFTPHVTLGYLEPGDHLPEPHPGVPLKFTHLTVRRGDQAVHYPLGGGMPHHEGAYRPQGPMTAPRDMHRIIDRTKRNGGHSISMTTGKSPGSGYMVAQEEGSHFMPAHEFFGPNGHHVLRSYIHAHADHLTQPGAHLGTWHDHESGNVFLDISHNVKNREEAHQMAAKHNQIAMWDIKGKQEVPTGGTGGLESVAVSAVQPCERCGLPKAKVSATMEFFRHGGQPDED